MSAASKRLGYKRAGRGAPVLDWWRWEAEITAAVSLVATTWRKTVPPARGVGRLRIALLRHAPTLLPLFAKGVPVARFAKLLIAEGVTFDNGAPLYPHALVSAWGRVEVALVRRVEKLEGAA